MKKNPAECPISSPVLNAKANPQIHQPSAAIEKLVRIFAITVPAFLPRENPISRNANPACMNMTTMPATITHSELMPTVCSSSPAIPRFEPSDAAHAPTGEAEQPGYRRERQRRDYVLSFHLLHTSAPFVNERERRALTGGCGYRNREPR